ncbi:SMI1 / KNR4 family (SUKH-1) [Enhydrobacter aerosaccus]|uniref:SMI1 / KNR4 family (SUKH-1) n=2 Tax=Enhydrobacter aerosaccus TaxID=225324 RepID=A0A1T4PTI4_9HYPH|nr:SMI1 / KNR4 family (SUKH-1) [Enhydrobacter aerosaccus]
MLDRPEMWKEFDANPPADPAMISRVEDESGFKLPEDFVRFLLRMNGGRGMVGEAFLGLWRAEDLVQHNKAYSADEAAPGFFIFGSDGADEAFGFDMRSAAQPVVCLPFIGMDWESAIPIAPTFTEFLDVVSTSWPDVPARL